MKHVSVNQTAYICTATGPVSVPSSHSGADCPSGSVWTAVFWRCLSGMVSGQISAAALHGGVWPTLHCREEADG